MLVLEDSANSLSIIPESGGNDVNVKRGAIYNTR
jgi:hypothetical protein